MFWVPNVKPNPNVFPFFPIFLDGLIILKSRNYIGIHLGKVLKSIFLHKTIPYFVNGTSSGGTTMRPTEKRMRTRTRRGKRTRRKSKRHNSPLRRHLEGLPSSF